MGHEKIVEILIEHGANVNLQSTVFIFFLFFSFLFFFFSFLFFFFSFFFHFLLVCCDGLFFDLFFFFFTNFFLLKYGWTALHIAALDGFEQIVKILIEHGSNVNLQDKVFSFSFFIFFFDSVFIFFFSILFLFVVCFLIGLFFFFFDVICFCFLTSFLCVLGWRDRSSQSCFAKF